MAPPKKKVEDDVEEELLDYEDEAVAIDAAADAAADAGKAAGGDVAKKGYVGIHSTGFRDFLLKPELLRAIVDCGFEHPSEGALCVVFSAFVARWRIDGRAKVALICGSLRFDSLILAMRFRSRSRVRRSRRSMRTRGRR